MVKKSVKRRVVWEIIIIGFPLLKALQTQQRKSSSESKTNFPISYLQRLGCLNHYLQMQPKEFTNHFAIPTGSQKPGLDLVHAPSFAFTRIA